MNPPHRRDSLYLVFTASCKQPGGLSLAGGGSLCPCSIKGEGGLTRYQHEGTNGNSPLIHWLNQSQANMSASSRVTAVSVQDASDTWSIWSSTLPTSRSLMPPTCSTSCLTTTLHAHFKVSLYRNDCHHGRECASGRWHTEPCCFCDRVPACCSGSPASSALCC